MSLAAAYKAICQGRIHSLLFSAGFGKLNEAKHAFRFLTEKAA
jgi:hypothetical protein